MWREAYRKADTRAETTIRVIINIIGSVSVRDSVSAVCCAKL